ncbi:hypothetical protein [Aneurinibacillus aneurinilyticus]|uniref:Uncharacterized protein n=1 Tax=Aneurinibacillus aneurinilyticus ATCC 12856 TaxID=649747 RepID=U1WX03_ANEAE|nr:hypothetical protein [Aneurinibacillus aneurinilyticus]ERI07215.1 hypothetical protein HMPREF0083_04686 [Aneurinibacillus aneurinilyticus ATCC 12856]MED0706851.1 hypothetical protein [Aneurinibacillus aneurinilyticus]MED0725926.1 hypothetical protein [Aneurinibacillus aneurinilyticus]MED0730363.1 hypothetical protein [Aneurinibacillus aneurinilyticus]MED0739192.1 hypothetical protein [Aneurinibacillus aneurinilyticus]
MMEGLKIGEESAGKLDTNQIAIANEFYLKLKKYEEDIKLRDAFLPVIRIMYTEKYHGPNEGILRNTLKALAEEYESNYSNEYWVSDIESNIRYAFK